MASYSCRYEMKIFFTLYIIAPKTWLKRISKVHTQINTQFITVEYTRLIDIIWPVATDICLIIELSGVWF